MFAGLTFDGTQTDPIFVTGLGLTELKNITFLRIQIHIRNKLFTGILGNRQHLTRNSSLGNSVLGIRSRESHGMLTRRERNITELGCSGTIGELHVDRLAGVNLLALERGEPIDADDAQSTGLGRESDGRRSVARNRKPDGNTGRTRHRRRNLNGEPTFGNTTLVILRTRDTCKRRYHH